MIGTLSVEMTDNQLAGLGNIEDGGLTYDDDNQTFSAALKASGALTFSGNYQIYSSSKATACAINAAHTLLGGSRDAEDEVAVADTESDNQKSDLDVARDYRTKLTQSNNGMTLVGTYYDNNEAMSIMFESGETPAQQWRRIWTEYPLADPNETYSRSLSDQTSRACRNPDDENYTVGGKPFNDRALSLQTGMKMMAGKMKSSGKYENDPRFNKLVSDIDSFKFAAENHNGEQTAGSVMHTVEHDPKDIRAQVQAGQFDPTPDDEYVEGIQEALAQIEAEDDDAASDPGYKTEAHGTFSDVFSFEEIRISGSVRPQGDSIGVSIASVALVGGSLTVKLGPPKGGSTSAYDKVAEAIGNAKFVNDLIVKKAGDKMNGADVRDYLSNRINQSVNKIFGDA